MIIRMKMIQRIYLFSKIVRARMKIELLLFMKKQNDIILDINFIYYYKLNIFIA
jgi:hypothetical protein